MYMSPPGGLTDVQVVVWPADKHLEEKLDGRVFQEELSVLNATHMIALLESRLKTRHGLPISLGKVEYYDSSMEKWLSIVAEHDLGKFEQPIKLRVWSRRRLFSCRVPPLRASVTDFASRKVSFYALDLEEFKEELRARVPPHDKGFRDVMYKDGAVGWVLLTDPNEIPSEECRQLEIKLVPEAHSIHAARAALSDERHAPADVLPLQHVVDLERQREGEESRARSFPERKKKLPFEYRKIAFGSVTVDMPSRLCVPSMPHTSAEVRRMHSDDIPKRFSSSSLAPPKSVPEPNRDACCYPGSGQFQSVDSSGHGDLKREVIAYTRLLLQDPHSPVQQYLPQGGLRTTDLVNLTALVAHHFMVQCDPRPGGHLTPEDHSNVHSILAHCLDETGLAIRVHEAKVEPEEKKKTQGPIYSIEGSGGEAFAPPQVVLIRPLLTEDGTVIFYGTVAAPGPVTCQWSLTASPVGNSFGSPTHVDIDQLFASGRAMTEPVSASSFSLKIEPGSLSPGVGYVLTLHVSTDEDGQTAQASQQFDLPS